MNVRGPSRVLAGFVALWLGLAAGANAQFLIGDDRYENFGGYTGGLGVLGGVANTTAGVQALLPTAANATLNPNGVGNFLVGEYYDVRPVGGNATHVNIQILNNNSNDPALPPCALNPFHPGFGSVAAFLGGLDGELCYNPYGGIVAKVRFRESRRSVEVLDFDIVLSCGEVWAGRLELRDDTPFLVSNYPIVATQTPGDPGLPPNGNGNVVTRTSGAGFDITDGLPFQIPGFAQPFVNIQDTQRGYFEVVGLSSVFCEPDLVINNTIPDANVGQGELNVNTATIPATFGESRWTWRNTPDILNTNFPATHAMSAVVFIVRAANGVSFEYNATAITRYRQVVPGAVAFNPNLWFLANEPNIEDCQGQDLFGVPFSSSQCVDQFNLILHKARIMGQYDTETTTAGFTNMVVTQPTKYANCGINGGSIHTPNPFECSLSGEEVSCIIYDRIENFVTEEGGVISPFPEVGECRLPREVTIVGIRAGSADAANCPNQANPACRADIYIDPSSLDLCTNPANCAGWLEIDTLGITKPGFTRFIIFNNVFTHNLDGIFVGGYLGLPAVGLVQQEFTNGNVGGAYGAIVPTTYDDPTLLNLPGS